MSNQELSVLIRNGESIVINQTSTIVKKDGIHIADMDYEMDISEAMELIDMLSEAVELLKEGL